MNCVWAAHHHSLSLIRVTTKSRETEFFERQISRYSRELCGCGNGTGTCKCTPTRGSSWSSNNVAQRLGGALPTASAFCCAAVGGMSPRNPLCMVGCVGALSTCARVRLLSVLGSWVAAEAPPVGCPPLLAAWRPLGPDSSCSLRLGCRSGRNPCSLVGWIIGGVFCTFAAMKLESAFCTQTYGWFWC